MEGEQESPGAMALSMQQFLQEKVSLNQLRLENENEIHQLEQILRGKHYDWTTKTWKESTRTVTYNGALYSIPDRLMNEKGIREIMMIVRMHANKVVFLSNFDDWVVNEMLHNFSCAILDTLSFKCDDYEIDRKSRVVIERALINFGWAIILRAWNDKERIHMDTINKVVEQIVQRERNPEKSFGAGLLKASG